MFCAILCSKGNIKYDNCTVLSPEDIIWDVTIRLHRFSFSTFQSSINLNVISETTRWISIKSFISWAIMLCNPLKKSPNISQEHATAISRVTKRVKQETSRKQVASRLHAGSLLGLLINPEE
jgi:hypothetical protein